MAEKNKIVIKNLGKKYETDANKKRLLRDFLIIQRANWNWKENRYANRDQIVV